MENRWCPHVLGTWDLLGDPFFFAEAPPIKLVSLFTANSDLFYLTLPTIGAMAGGGEARGHVMLVSPYSVGCAKYGDTQFDHKTLQGGGPEVKYWLFGLFWEGWGRELLVSPYAAGKELVWGPFRFSWGRF